MTFLANRFAAEIGISRCIHERVSLGKGQRKGYDRGGWYGVPFPRKRPRQGRTEVNDEFSQAILPRARILHY